MFYGLKMGSPTCVKGEQANDLDETNEFPFCLYWKCFADESQFRLM